MDEALQRALLGQHLLGDPEGGVRVGHAAVDRALQEHLPDLVDREAVAPRGPQVQRELLVVAAGDQGGEGDHRAAAPVEAGSRPDLAPGVGGDQLLEVAGEIGGVRGRPVDVLVAEHLPPDPHALVVGHRAPSRQCSRIRSATASGASAGARWATPRSSAYCPRSTPSATSRSRSGGQTVSCSPATASTGTPISPSRSRTSKVASARQTATYPSSSASLSACSSAEARAGSRSRKPVPNQRPADALTRPGVPEARTCAIRSAHDSSVPIRAPVQSATTPRTRSGASSASCSPTAPPAESPAWKNG